MYWALKALLSLTPLVLLLLSLLSLRPRRASSIIRRPALYTIYTYLVDLLLPLRACTFVIPPRTRRWIRLFYSMLRYEYTLHMQCVVLASRLS